MTMEYQYTPKNMDKIKKIVTGSNDGRHAETLDTHTLLLGMCNGTATLEYNV